MKVVVSDNMKEEVREEIGRICNLVYKPGNLSEEIRDADVLIVRSATRVTAELLKDSSLKLIIRAGVGIDNIDVAAARGKGIRVMNTPGASTNAVAELALGMIISSMRNVQKAHHQMKTGQWKKKELVGREIAGKTLGIIGYGRIGESLGQKAHALGMGIIAYNVPPRSGENVEFVELDELYARADVISLHVPATEQTKDMINAGSISKMKDGVLIVNTSRGEVVDEDALYDGLKSGKIMGAALDVYKHEPYSGKLLELDNVYFTPHIAASTAEAQERIGEEIIMILKAEK